MTATTRIGRLRLAGAGDDSPALRQAVSRQLAAAEVYPAELPPAAVLVVRHLRDPAPGRFDGQAWRLADDWEQALRRRLAGLATTAARPAEGDPGADAEAVIFADRADLWTCLLRDRWRGSTGRRWWWQRLDLALDRPWQELIVDHLELLPAICERLAHSGHLGELAENTPPAVAESLLRGLAQRLELPSELLPVRGNAATTPTTGPPREPWAPWLPALTASWEARQRALVGLCRAYAAAPTRCHQPLFRLEAQAWWQHQATPRGAEASERSPRLIPASESHGSSPPDFEAEPSTPQSPWSRAPERRVAATGAPPRRAGDDRGKTRDRAASEAPGDSTRGADRKSAVPAAASPRQDRHRPSAEAREHDEPAGLRPDSDEGQGPRAKRRAGSSDPTLALPEEISPAIDRGAGSEAAGRQISAHRATTPPSPGEPRRSGHRDDDLARSRPDPVPEATADASQTRTVSDLDPTAPLQGRYVTTAFGGLFFLIRPLEELAAVTPEVRRSLWQEMLGLGEALLGARLHDDPVAAALASELGEGVEGSPPPRSGSPPRGTPKDHPARNSSPPVSDSPRPATNLLEEVATSPSQADSKGSKGLRARRREWTSDSASQPASALRRARRPFDSFASIYRLPHSWAEASVGPVSWASAQGRLVIWRDGEVLADLPRNDSPPSHQARHEIAAGAWPATGPTVALRRQPRAEAPQPAVEAGSPWIQRALPAIAARLARAGVDLERLLAMPAQLYLTSSHLDLIFDLDAISLPVRRAGLDRDPGWLPRCGRVVQFHFRQEPPP